jgi:hypothetical protein
MTALLAYVPIKELEVEFDPDGAGKRCKTLWELPSLLSVLLSFNINEFEAPSTLSALTLNTPVHNFLHFPVIPVSLTCGN